MVPVGHPGHDDAVQVLHHLGPVLACLGGGAGHQLAEVAGRNLSRYMHFKTFHMGIFNCEGAALEVLMYVRLSVRLSVTGQVEIFRFLKLPEGS